jgi:peroxiredoxin
MSAAEAAARDLGPGVGERAPTEWSARDQMGAARSLADLAGPEGAVILFNRSFDWCPFCQRQMLDIEANYDAFAERGYGVVALTHDDYEINARFAGRHELRSVLLSDPGSAIIRDFDVLDPAFIGRPGRLDGLPYPIAFVLSPEGEVKAKFWHEPGLGEERGYRTRITAEDMLAVLDGLE